MPTVSGKKGISYFVAVVVQKKNIRFYFRTSTLFTSLPVALHREKSISHIREATVCGVSRFWFGWCEEEIEANEREYYRHGPTTNPPNEGDDTHNP